MNDLSFLIYWASVAPQLSSFVAFTMFILFALAAFGVAVNIETRVEYEQVKSWDAVVAGWLEGGIANKEVPWQVKDTYGRLNRANANVHLATKISWPIAIASFLLWGGSFLVPDKDTFYLIAASEAGEQAIQTPEFTKLRTLLNQYLDDAIEGENKEATK